MERRELLPCACGYEKRRRTWDREEPPFSRWRFREEKLHFGVEVIFQLAAVPKRLTATFIVRVQIATGEQLTEVQNCVTGAKQAF